MQGSNQEKVNAVFISNGRWYNRQWKEWNTHTTTGRKSKAKK